MVSSNQHTLHQEQELIGGALLACNFPLWSLNGTLTKFNSKYNSGSTHTTNQDHQNNSNNTGSNKKNISIVVPYMKDLSEKFQKTCNSIGIQVHFKGTNINKSLLMASKDKDNKIQKSGVIYWFKCPHSNYHEKYIGESGRSFGERLKEHLRAPSPIYHHGHTTGHPINQECFTRVERELQGIIRTIKEAMYIHVNDPSLNRNLEKYQLPHSGHSITTAQITQQHHTPPLPYNGQPKHTLCEEHTNLVSMISCGVPLLLQHSPYSPMSYTLAPQTPTPFV